MYAERCAAGCPSLPCAVEACGMLWDVVRSSVSVAGKPRGVTSCRFASGAAPKPLQHLGTISLFQACKHLLALLSLCPFAQSYCLMTSHVSFPPFVKHLRVGKVHLRQRQERPAEPAHWDELPRLRLGLQKRGEGEGGRRRERERESSPGGTPKC